MEKVKYANVRIALLVLTFCVVQRSVADQLVSSSFGAPQFIKVVKLFDRFAGLPLPQGNPKIIGLYALYKCHIAQEKLNQPVGAIGETYLIYAVRQQDVDAVRALLKLEHIDVDAKSANNQTALDVALELGNQEIIDLLQIRRSTPSAVMPSISSSSISEADDEYESDSDDDAKGNESGDSDDESNDYMHDKPTPSDDDKESGTYTTTAQTSTH